MARIGKGRSALYDDVRQGLMVPPIKLGARRVGWIEREVSSILDARCAGAGHAELRALVERLIAKRASLMPRKV